jgi:mRNA interferase RelE/StbE
VTDRRYELRFRPAALRQLRKLDTQIARRIKGATEALRVEPRPPGVKALTGQHGWLRIRVGDYAWMFPGYAQNHTTGPRQPRLSNFYSVLLRGAGGARTHDRRIMRSTAPCTECATCTDGTS